MDSFAKIVKASKLFIGNVNENIATEDIYEFSVLKSNPYLC